MAGSGAGAGRAGSEADAAECAECGEPRWSGPARSARPGQDRALCPEAGSTGNSLKVMGLSPWALSPQGEPPGPSAHPLSSADVASSAGALRNTGNRVARLCRHDAAGSGDVAGGRGLFLRGPCLLAGPWHLSP